MIIGLVVKAHVPNPVHICPVPFAPDHTAHDPTAPVPHIGRVFFVNLIVFVHGVGFTPGADQYAVIV